MSETKRDNKALYQLRQEIEDCLTLEADEEFDLDELDMLILSFEEKVESCLAYIKNLQAAGEGLAAEIKRLKAQKRAVVKTTWHGSNVCTWRVDGAWTGKRFGWAYIAVAS